VGQATLRKVLFGRHLRMSAEELKFCMNLLYPPAAQLKEKQ
jgi:hypothetical protein